MLINLKALLLIIMMTSALLSSTPDIEVWNTYKKNFLQNDGRVIDFKNADITHTEGIGYALYFSYAFHDQKSFKLIHQWYHNNIKFNVHKLPGWKWGKADDGTWKMLDKNSASDANLWIAHALLLMYERHNNRAYKDEALMLLNAIKTYQIKSVDGQIFLLPGEKGFENKETLTLNLSYLALETFKHFQAYDPDPIWQSLIDSSKNQLMHMRFSALALNPDWLIYNTQKKKSALQKNNAMFGYDAIRIPLNIIRSSLSHKEKVALLQPYKDYISMMQHLPLGVVNLQTGMISMYNLSYGHLAVYRFIQTFFKGNTTMFDTLLQERMKQEYDDYYAYSLYLFTVL